MTHDSSLLEEQDRQQHRRRSLRHRQRARRDQSSSHKTEDADGHDVRATWTEGASGFYDTLCKAGLVMSRLTVGSGHDP